jgi:hypothetical protein
MYDFSKITIGKINIVKNESCSSFIHHEQYKAFNDINNSKIRMVVRKNVIIYYLGMISVFFQYERKIFMFIRYIIKSLFFYY